MIVVSVETASGTVRTARLADDTPTVQDALNVLGLSASSDDFVRVNGSDAALDHELSNGDEVRVFQRSKGGKK